MNELCMSNWYTGWHGNLNIAMFDWSIVGFEQDLGPISTMYNTTLHANDSINCISEIENYWEYTSVIKDYTITVK